MADPIRKLAVVTGASTGIGLELARQCAKNGYDLLIAADEAEIETAADELRREGGNVEAVQADLATLEGVDELYRRIEGRHVDALLANAGRGLGRAFLDQDFKDIRRVINTNITGTVYLIHKIGGDMRSQGAGRILITGSIAGFIPGTFQAVYNGTKAFVELIFVRITSRAPEVGRDRDVPDARSDRNGIFRACGHDGHESWHV